jgi:orotate phosphoribosyltransferase
LQRSGTAINSTYRTQRAEQILIDCRAILRGGHFVYVTGQHGDGWVDKDSIFPNTDHTSELCGMLAETCSNLGAEIICGPATGGLIVSQWTAHHMGLPSVFADHAKEQGYHPAAVVSGPLRPPFILKRHYDRAVSGKRVLVVDDVINTGLSLRETADAVRGAGGKVIATAALCTRGNAKPEDCGAERMVALCEVIVPTWPAEECELCKRGIPVNTEFAHGADFLAQQSALARV